MNKFRISFEDLTQALAIGSSLLSDKSLSDDNKFMIFTATPEGWVEFSSYSSMGIARRAIECIESSVDSDWQFSVRPSDISKIVSSFSGLTVTKIEYIEFEDKGNRLSIVGHEVPKKEEWGSEYEGDMHFTVSSATIPDQVSLSVGSHFPEDVQWVSARKLRKDLATLLPLLAKDASGGSSSNLYNTSEYMYVTTSSMFSFVKNTLPAVMHDKVFGQTAISSIKKLCEVAINGGDLTEEELNEDIDDGYVDEEDVDDLMNDEDAFLDEEEAPSKPVEEDVKIEIGVVSNSEGRLMYLALRYGTTEVLVRPKGTKLVDHRQYTESIFLSDEEGNYPNRQLGVGVNRMFLQSVLKRSWDWDGGEVNFSFTEDSMLIQTDSVDKSVPLVGVKGDITKVKFNISMALLSNMILGNDKEFAADSPNVFLYFVPSRKRGYTLYVADKNWTWVSAMVVAARR